MSLPSATTIVEKPRLTEFFQRIFGSFLIAQPGLGGDAVVIGAAEARPVAGRAIESDEQGESGETTSEHGGSLPREGAKSTGSTAFCRVATLGA